MPLSEHVYCVATAFKVNEQIEQQICIRFCIKLEHSSAETIWMIKKAAAMCNWWLTALSQQCAHWCIMSHAEFFSKTSNHQVSPTLYNQDFVSCDFWLFPKLKSPLRGKRFQTIVKIQGNMMGQDGDWEYCVWSQGAYFEGDRGVIVLCTMFLVFFFNRWLYFS